MMEHDTGLKAFPGPCLVLTCTIDVKGIAFMDRSDIAVRLGDYRKSLERWIANPAVRNIVVVENSDYDLSELRRIAEAAKGRKAVEFISCDKQDFPRDRGKGYGETLALMEVAEKSALLRQSGYFLKVNGRYYLPNAAAVLADIAPGTGVYCSLTDRLRWVDSRVFGGSAVFLRDYVCREGLLTDDVKGMYFEHRLAIAALRAIADGLVWRPQRVAPHIAGISGTNNKNFRTNPLRQFARTQWFRLRSALFEK